MTSRNADDSGAQENHDKRAYTGLLLTLVGRPGMPGADQDRSKLLSGKCAGLSRLQHGYGDLMGTASPRRRDRVTGAARWGALALLVRPAYIATEFVVAAATTGGYSFLTDSVSRLGEVGCSAAFCSPRHELMNGSFMGFGALLAGGALLLRRPLGPWVTGLLVVSGLSSVATGLAPLDQVVTMHAIAAAPLFVAQPIALIALGARLRDSRPRLAGALLATGAVTAAASVTFVLSGDGPASGVLERLALWPVLLGLAGFAWTRRAGEPRQLRREHSQYIRSSSRPSGAIAP